MHHWPREQHRNYAPTLPPISPQDFSVVDTKPVPLQEAWPPHALFAVLQSL